jgi:hypothetical protein
MDASAFGTSIITIPLSDPSLLSPLDIRAGSILLPRSLVEQRPCFALMSNGLKRKDWMRIDYK